MGNQSVHETAGVGQPKPYPDAFHLAAELVLPAAGAQVLSVIGECKTVGHVLLAPGSGLSRHDREQIVSAHPIVTCSIRAEAPFPWQRPPLREDFHQPTVRWMFERADYISIWSAPFPQFADEHGKASLKAVEDGAKFMVVVETEPCEAAEWAAFARRHMRKTAEIVFFGPENDSPPISPTSHDGRRA